MLSKKTRYAIMAMTALAKEYGKGPVAMSLIAESKNIPLRFLEGILLELKRAGILESTRGVDGGYSLKRPPETITLSEIIKVTEGSVRFVSCQDCNPETGCEFGWNTETCGIRKVFSEMYSRLTDELERTTLKDVIQ